MFLHFPEQLLLDRLVLNNCCCGVVVAVVYPTSDTSCSVFWGQLVHSLMSLGDLQKDYQVRLTCATLALAVRRSVRQTVQEFLRIT